MVAPKGAAWELYDLAKDRAESTDLASARRAKRDELVALWERKMAEFKQVALMDQPPKPAARARGGKPAVKPAVKQKRGQVLINAERLELLGKRAFIMQPKQAVEPGQARPWIFYAPTLGGTPDRHESWMHQQLQRKRRMKRLRRKPKRGNHPPLPYGRPTGKSSSKATAPHVTSWAAKGSRAGSRHWMTRLGFPVRKTG